MSSGFSTPRLLGAALLILAAGAAGFLAYRARHADAPTLTAAPVGADRAAGYEPPPAGATAKKSVPDDAPRHLAGRHERQTDQARELRAAGR